MKIFGKLNRYAKKSVSKSQVKALLPTDFPERMTGYFHDIYKKGVWTTLPDSERGYDRFIVIALMKKGDGAPPQLQSALEKEGMIGSVPTFDCDLTSYNLDYETIHIFMKYIGKILAFSLDFDMQDWQSTLLWSDSEGGGTAKVGIGRGYRRIG